VRAQERAAASVRQGVPHPFPRGSSSQPVVFTLGGLPFGPRRGRPGRSACRTGVIRAAIRGFENPLNMDLADATAFRAPAGLAFFRGVYCGAKYRRHSSPSASLRVR
jgi:hypothetical protein